MDEAEVQQKARSFIAGVDTKVIPTDLFVYLQSADAKVVKEELEEGESGYTITKPNGIHIISA